jgi:hypothetical protein
MVSLRCRSISGKASTPVGALGDFRSLRACNQRATESRSSVLITRSAGMPPFRAIAKPQRVKDAI